MFNHGFDLELVVLGRLVLASVLAAALGWEREAAGKPAGLRTHILVAFGAALFVGLGGFVMQEFQPFGENVRYDPTRILEAVVTGVSFLGAGTIFITRGKTRVEGLTTAASLWTTAGVGLAAGLGRYVVAVGSTLLLFIVLHVLGRFERSREERR